MPRKQDFSQSTIYHIRGIETKKVCYVGSTTQFCQRKTHHEFRCNTELDKYYNLPIYCYIRENGGWDCFEIIPVSFLKLENKTQLFVEEQKEMDKHDGLVNIKKSHITTEQRKERHRKDDKNIMKNIKGNIMNIQKNIVKNIKKN